MDGALDIGDDPPIGAGVDQEPITSKHATISIIPHFTGFLSVLGSLFIIIDILHPRNRAKKMRKVYNRILLGMSLSDLCSSMAMSLSTWPMPNATNLYATLGTQGTCTAQGFFVQMGTAAPLYSGFLSVYYVLMVRYNWSETRGRMITWEIRFHCLAWLLTLGTALAALGLEQYNPANLWCWIAPLPNDCVNSSKSPDGTSTCKRGDNAYIYRIAFYFVWLWLSIIVVTAATSLVVHSVWTKVRESRRYDIREELHRNIIKRLSMRRVVDTARKQPKSAQEKNLSRVVVQGSLYIGAFYLTAVFPSVVRMVQARWNCTYEHYFLSILTATFYPMQGFWNFFIYVRPRYLKYRKDHPRRGSFHAASATLGRSLGLLCCRGSSDRQHEKESTSTPNPLQNVVQNPSTESSRPITLCRPSSLLPNGSDADEKEEHSKDSQNKVPMVCNTLPRAGTEDIVNEEEHHHVEETCAEANAPDIPTSFVCPGTSTSSVRIDIVQGSSQCKNQHSPQRICPGRENENCQSLIQDQQESKERHPSFSADRRQQLDSKKDLLLVEGGGNCRGVQGSFIDNMTEEET